MPKTGCRTAPGYRVLMKVRDVRKALAEDGWKLKNTKGSHRQYIHTNKPGKVTVNGHPSDEVAPGTLGSIMKQAGLK
jgi:predicted RNA binding protein YcfA (HicA-like mRNA interferase family)